MTKEFEPRDDVPEEAQVHEAYEGVIPEVTPYKLAEVGEVVYDGAES
jgi:hypothetical protein